MKRNTIKWRIFKYNIVAIVVLIALITIIFDIAVKLYIEKDTTNQLKVIASHAEYTALHRGPDFFPKDTDQHMSSTNPPPLIKIEPPKSAISKSQNSASKAKNSASSKPEFDSQNDKNKLFRFYFVLDRSLREPLSILNADYLLLSKNKQPVSFPQEDYFKPSPDIETTIKSKIEDLKIKNKESYINFNLAGKDYIAIIKPVSNKNSFGLGFIVVFSSLQKLNQLQLEINLILFFVLILSALIFSIFSSITAKKISAPFSLLNQGLKAIAERNFGEKIDMTLDDELQDFVHNINAMSEKLESYDKAQKTFLQNVSHEFRTPLMSIQGYAEGIKYEVVDNNFAAEVIIDETKNMTSLVEDLLYLSRLDSIEEIYNFKTIVLNSLLNSCIDRIRGIAINKNITLCLYSANEEISISGDEEKLSRAITNILNNCIRYAKNNIKITSKIIEIKYSQNEDIKVPINNNFIKSDHKIVEIQISDDGSGFDKNDIENLFERFYKGKNGNFGLGLAITKNIIEKHGGEVIARNSKIGAEFIIYLPSQ